MTQSLSVIVPTVNAVDELDMTLTSLQKNSDLDLEIIVVVDPDRGTGKVNDKILKICKKHTLEPVINKKNRGPYGNWNRGAKQASHDFLVFATDDQYFAPHWDTNLVKAHKTKRLVAGRLVEPGIIPVWRTNIQKNFGVIPSEFNEKAFTKWCSEQKSSGFVTDGFFIPLLMSKDDYAALGGYPEAGTFGTSTAVSNDINFVEKAKSHGYEFGTAADSYSYHFQASSWKKKTLKPTIAAVILAKNEENDLPACLKSLSWVTEKIIIDSGSTDKTLEIANDFQAKVYTNTFEDFSTQRNFALAQVSTFDWVLMIDADEVVEKELVDELLSFAKDIYLDGVMIPRKNYIFGKWIEHADWYPDERLVFFRPKLVKFVGDVHERAQFIKGNGASSTARNHLIHNNYKNIREFVVKNIVDYPAQYAIVLHKQKVPFTASDLLLKPFAEFMRRYFLREGYKDGMYGFILSILMGVQTMIAYAYLWEMQGKRKDLTTEETERVFELLRSKGAELTYWLTTMAIDSSSGATKLINRARRKALKLVKGL